MQPSHDLTMHSGNVLRGTPQPRASAAPGTTPLSRPERRRHPRVPSLVLSPEERARLTAGAEEEGSPPVRRAVLWEENPDLTACLRTLCALAETHLVVVTTAEALLAEAAHMHAGDVLVIDCSWAYPEDLSRCVTIISQAVIPTLVFHPHPEIIEMLQILARGLVIGLDPAVAGIAVLEQLRLLGVALPAPAAPAPPPPPHESWSLLQA